MPRSSQAPERQLPTIHDLKSRAGEMREYAALLGLELKQSQVLQALGALHGTTWEHLRERPHLNPVKPERRFEVLYDTLCAQESPEAEAEWLAAAA